MIGYMKPQKEGFSKEDQSLYRSVYCGLCRCLRYGYDLTGTLALNYELTNALLLLGACAPEPYPLTTQSCSLTPLYWRPMAGMDQDCFHVAAGLTVTLAALEIRDNVLDNDRWIDHCLDRIFSPKNKRVSSRMYAEHSALCQVYEQYMALENKARKPIPDASFQSLVSASGAMAAECTRIIARHSACPPDQQTAVCHIMELWGEWIYLIDAVDDYQEDLKNGRFNPLLLPDHPDSIEDHLCSIEDRANSLLSSLKLNHYATAVRALFCSQLPNRRRKLFSNV